MSLLAELTRRKVFKVGGAYLVVAWLAVQAASIGFPAFDAPPWALRIFILVALLGFPIALVFAWAFEITPNGVRPESGARSTRAILLIAAVLTLLAFVWYFKGQPSYRAETPPPSPNVSVAAAKPSSADATIVAVPISSKSIAVLPFENLSEEKANAYFATGMQDEILTRLAGIHDLKVISRTSTEQYASHPPNLKIVAEQLGVATVLEGSVQRADGKVRINLQLIDARNDSHLWAQNYDRDLKDVFAVQSDVAEKVADALKAQLLPAESARIANVPTQNPEAYDLYLRANAYYQRANDQFALVPKVMPLAIALYQQALAKDPGFALAAAMLAQAHMRTYWNLPDHSETRLAAAKAAVEQALALQPDLGEAHEALGMYWYYGHRDYAQALQQLDLARKTLPNSASVELYTASIARRQGRWNDAIAGFQRAIVLDPRSSLSIDQLADAYTKLRRYAEAEQVFARAVAVTHDPTDEQVTRAYNTVMWKGDLAPLRAALGSLTTSSDDYAGNAWLSFQLGWWSRDYPATVKIAETDTAANWSGQSNETFPRQLYLAWAFQAAGDNAKVQPVYAEVRSQMHVALQQQPDDADLHLALGFAAAGLGLKGEAIREGRKAIDLMPMSRDAYSAPGYLAYLAQLYVRVGENDQAIDTLRQLFAGPSGGGAISPALLKLDPIWDPLRKDPRFLKLLEEHANDDKAAHP